MRILSVEERIGRFRRVGSGVILICAGSSERELVELVEFGGDYLIGSFIKCCGGF